MRPDGRPAGIDAAEHVTVTEYVAHHRVSTPTIAREKIRDVADFLRAGN